MHALEQIIRACMLYPQNTAKLPCPGTSTSTWVKIAAEFELDKEIMTGFKSISIAHHGPPHAAMGIEICQVNTGQHV
jgi:hypothetical protein